MSESINVVAILGSPRAPSYTRGLAEAVIRALVERGARVETLDLRATPLPVLATRFADAGLDTRYYTPAVHQAAFALPRYIAALIA